MWKEVPRTRKKEVLSSHHVESSRPSLTIASLKVQPHVSDLELSGQILSFHEDRLFQQRKETDESETAQL